MTDTQLYLASGVPVTAVLASMVISLMQISGVRDETREIRADMRQMRGDLGEIRSDLRLILKKARARSSSG